MENATILIPDISGFTEFMAKTEIRHSAHIINELLEVIVQSNQEDFHLSEIEGDAVLFYKKGKAIERDLLLAQCIAMYRNFHTQLKVIERDSICRCGACTTASDLTLKFIVHYGEIQEIKISNFLKASGLDMIVAHRLLKNKIDTHEYILLSEPYCKNGGEADQEIVLDWKKDAENYDSIGKVDFEYCYLTDLKKEIPLPPNPPEPPKPAPNAKSLEIEINASQSAVYQNLIDTEKRNIWVTGMTELKYEPLTERAGFHHYCLTDGVGIDHTVVEAKFEEKEITYIEKVVIRKNGLTAWDYYKVEKLDENRTRFSIRFAFEKRNIKSWFLERLIIRRLKKDFKNFKEMCEEV